jgi:protein O-GlcNAc transferase
LAKLSVDRELQRARALERKGEPAAARAVLEDVLRAFPNNRRAREALAALGGAPGGAQGGQPPQERVEALVALYRNGDFGRVAADAAALAAAYPASFVLWSLLGATCKRLGRADEAERAFRNACRADPRSPDAHNNLGVALKELGRADEAAACYRQAIALRPDYAVAHNNLGNALYELGRLDEAAGHFARACRIAPDYAEALYNLGVALAALGRFEDAVKAYRSANAARPGNAETLNNLGNALYGLGRTGEAVERYREAIAARGEFADAHYNLGVALKDLGNRPEAVESLERALALRPGYTDAIVLKLHQQANMCDWRAIDAFEAVKETLATEDGTNPFPLLAFEDRPERQAQRSRAYAERSFRRAALPTAARPERRPERLRVGYFSADFHDHATLYLMSGLPRLHDRSRFEVFAYSYGATRTGAMRDRLEADADRFFDVADMPDRAVAELARSHGIDIAVDLKGYTQFARTGIFAWRPAPIQVNYLGYPGTMAADFMDYIVADPVVVPDAERAHYSEAAIFLPHSYQPNDDTRTISDAPTARADFGLPEKGFVFCCFNNNYKIRRREFDIWMRLLARLDGSVLWLLRSNEWAEANLRREADARGIDPARLVFAAPLPHDEHLARHRHADLFVDTFNYNAHTTASDALWARLPVVTLAGRQFAARVAASLLTAAGLPELIAETEDAYERLILGLATDAGRLAAVRDRLAAARAGCPLFDTEAYTRDFERALEAAYDRYLKGLPPADIRP